jgi:hypothetical protein
MSSMATRKSTPGTPPPLLLLLFLPCSSISSRRLGDFLNHVQSQVQPKSSRSVSETHGSFATIFVRPFSKPPSPSPSAEAAPY